MGELARPSVVAEILERHGLRLTRSLGQHFLVDGNVLARMVEAAALTSGDTVLEIGPGPGGLTRALLAVLRDVIASQGEGQPGVHVGPDALTTGRAV